MRVSHAPLLFLGLDSILGDGDLPQGHSAAVDALQPPRPSAPVHTRFGVRAPVATITTEGVGRQNVHKVTWRQKRHRMGSRRRYIAAATVL